VHLCGSLTSVQLSSLDPSALQPWTPIASFPCAAVVFQCFARCICCSSSGLIQALQGYWCLSLGGLAQAGWERPKVIKDTPLSRTLHYLQGSIVVLYACGPGWFVSSQMMLLLQHCAQQPEIGSTPKVWNSRYSGYHMQLALWFVQPIAQLRQPVTLSCPAACPSCRLTGVAAIGTVIQAWASGPLYPDIAPALSKINNAGIKARHRHNRAAPTL